MFVPVESKDGKKLMPTQPNKAGMLIKKGLATPYWSNGVFCIRLNYDTTEYTQDIVVGIDPGSKKEGFSVKSQSRTYLNVQLDAHKDVGKKIEKRRELRRSRRSRKCPNRKNRTNRLAYKERIPAGTRARWGWKLRIIDWLCKLYPISHVCVEDMKARTKPDKDRWNKSFSPLEVGKRWFMTELLHRFGIGNVLIYRGLWTSARRKVLGLEKLSDKMSDSFYAYCVDSWVMAHSVVNGDSKKAMSCQPDNTDVFCISPIPIARRNLHREQPKKGGIRSRYGGTILKDGLVKNTLVRHVRYGLTRLSGINAKGLFAIYSLDGKRLTTSAKQSDFKILTKLNFQYR